MRSMLKEGVGVENVDVVEGDFRRAMRLGAGGDENSFGLETACGALRAGDADRVRVFERGLAAD